MTQVGQCPHCRAMNSYEVAQCLDCRQPLPWSGTVQKYTSQMQAARNAVQQLQSQVQQLQQAPQPATAGVTSNGIPIPPAPTVASFGGEVREAEASTDRFHEFIAAFIGPKAAEFFEDMNEDRARIAAFLMAGLWDLCVVLGTWLILRNLSSLFTSIFSSALGMGGAGASALGGIPGLTPAIPQPTGPQFSFTTIMKILAISTFAWGVLVGLCSLTRTIGRGVGSFAGDLFIGSATLLPAGLFLVLAGVVGLGNYDFVAALWLMAACYVVVALYRGLVTVSKVHGSVAAICTPLIFLLDGFALKVVITRLLSP